MSYYYTYYIGIKKSDGKIYPVGIYDDGGQIHPIFSRSSSFASHIYDSFHVVKRSEVSDALENEFRYYINDNRCKVLPLRELGSVDFMKSGYFLISEVEEYLEHKDDYTFESEIFSHHLDATVFAAKVVAECNANLSTRRPVLDAEGNEVNDWHPYYEYMYFAYPSYQCEEWENFLIQNAFAMIDPYNMKTDQLYVVLVEG